MAASLDHDRNQVLEHTAVSLIRDAQSCSIRLRLLGSLAIRSVCHHVLETHASLRRSCHDIDLVGRSDDATRIADVLERAGFVGDTEFNYVNSGSRMLFHKQDIRVDFLLDDFNMNHRWSLKTRLPDGQITLPFEDLLLSKLQLVHHDLRDVQDLLALSLAKTPDAIDFRYLTTTCVRSWGFTVTVLNSCVNATRHLALVPHDSVQAGLFFHTVSAQISAAPKPMPWHLRSLFGTWLPWYQLVEETT